MKRVGFTNNLGELCCYCCNRRTALIGSTDQTISSRSHTSANYDAAAGVYETDMSRNEGRRVAVLVRGPWQLGGNGGEN